MDRDSEPQQMRHALSSLFREEAVKAYESKGLGRPWLQQSRGDVRDCFWLACLLIVGLGLLGSALLSAGAG